MCGISVIVALQGQTHQFPESASSPIPNGVDIHLGKDPKHDAYAAKLSRELDDSLKVIDHRGPDSRGQWISDCKRVGPPALLSLIEPLSYVDWSTDDEMQLWAIID